ncbi:MAG TPA: hypothetical protein VF064_21010 [Pyrinomonadaceae bacterium]
MCAEAEPYRDDEEVLKVVRGFESCECAPDDFNHRSHLVVALCYLLREPEEKALARMRGGLLKFLAHHRIDPATVYHETLTVFWLKRVRAFTERAGHGRTLAALANELAESCGNSRVVFDYYSKELVGSEEARRALVEPDLKPLDF